MAQMRLVLTGSGLTGANCRPTGSGIAAAEKACCRNPDSCCCSTPWATRRREGLKRLIAKLPSRDHVLEGLGLPPQFSTGRAPQKRTGKSVAEFPFCLNPPFGIMQISTLSSHGSALVLCCVRPHSRRLHRLPCCASSADKGGEAGQSTGPLNQLSVTIK